MNASDIMVSNVITVSPDACVRDVAKLLLDNCISAVPVVNKDGKLVGIISEGDLMRRAETGTERHRSWWLAMLSSNEPLAAEFIRSHVSGWHLSPTSTQEIAQLCPDGIMLGGISAFLMISDDRRERELPLSLEQTLGSPSTRSPGLGGAPVATSYPRCS